MSGHRCFVSLDLPARVRETVAEVQQVLRIQQPELRFTSLENLHLTLKFLGKIPSETMADVEARLRRLPVSPFTVRLAHAGCFSPRIVWIALQGAEALQQQVDVAVSGLFPPERRFMGHVTIARARRMPPPLREVVAALEVPRLAFEVASFSLQVSHLSHLGARYESVARFAVGAP